MGCFSESILADTEGRQPCPRFLSGRKVMEKIHKLQKTLYAFAQKHSLTVECVG